MEPLLSLQNITKRYPGVVALDDVSVSFMPGEVHALVGENGAGKSTLIKVLSGAITPEEGSIILDGTEHKFMTPVISRDLGIAVVYQELIQMEDLTVAENIFMSTINESFIVNKKKLNENTAHLLENFNTRISPSDKIGDLSTACRQVVEIAKAMSANARIIVFDEPTAALTVEEQKNLFDIIRSLKKQGITVIYISHRLDEIFEICDRVTVMRDGKVIETLNTSDTDKHELINIMVGREINEIYPEHHVEPDAEVVLSAHNITGNGVEDISFDLHKGEILGFGGLVGAGRTELMRVIFGADKMESGELIVNGERRIIKSPSDALKLRIGMIPEDRKNLGCFTTKDIVWNISISDICDISHFTMISTKKEKKQAQEYVDTLRIKTPDIYQTVDNLSGGNQQKVVLAKSLASQSDIIIFDEPTRGIDVGARSEIYNLMVDLTNQGKSIIMVSSDMEELLGMSDRIVVLHEGKFSGELKKEEFAQNRVLQLASGI